MSNEACGPWAAARKRRVPHAATFKPVCNRTETTSGAKFTLPDDGMIQIVPVGTATSFEGVKQIVDAAALEAMLRNRGTGELLMDREHESHDPEKRTDALAWLDLSTLEKRPDGLYAKPRLTNSGERDVLGGTLRFVSPEFDRETMQEVGGGFLRPTQLVGASFTNRPAFRHGRPVTNRDQNPESRTQHPASMKKELCALLKLDESSADSVVLNRIGEIIAKAADHDKVAAELQTVKNREADDLIAAHEEIIPKDAELRKTLRSLILTNRAGADALITGFKAASEGKAATTTRAERKPVFNRETAAQPSDDEKAKKAANAKAATVKNRAQAICDQAKAAGRTITWADAWAAAEAEQPD